MWITLGTILYFFSIFITFFLLKYWISFFYKKRYFKLILVDTLLVSIYIILGSSLFEITNDIRINTILGVLIWLIIPYLYAFIKPKILRKYFDWEVGIYYPITEFFVIIVGYILSSLLLIALLRVNIFI